MEEGRCGCRERSSCAAQLVVESALDVRQPVRVETQLLQDRGVPVHLTRREAVALHEQRLALIAGDFDDGPPDAIGRL